jgi:penicillin-binding protein 1A
VWVRRVLIAAAIAVVVIAIAGGVVYANIVRQLPDPAAPLKGRDQTTVITDRNGTVITELFAEQNRTDVKLETMPAYLRQAVVATEDQRFYEHRGVDPLGILRALWVDITRPNVLHGGSTITQQYVKVAIVTSERTLKRKLMEAVLAYRLERSYTKDQILELYLNSIYYGHGAYSVQTAAQTYFGKDVKDLSLAECAMLAGVVKSPGRYSPILDAEAAKNRRATVLTQMVELGYVSAADAEAAKAEPFTLAERTDVSALAPYFVEYVKATVTEELGADLLYRGGLHITTSLDLTMQAAAEKAIAESLDKEDDPSASLVALDPATGEIVAMVGGRDFATQQFNVAVQGRRQPGSAFKPFVLVTGLMSDVSPEQTFECGARSFELDNGQTWKVTGASGGRKGAMRLREATEDSVNSVFAQLILDVGAEKVVKTAKDMGIGTEILPVPAIALGGLENGVSPLEMASAYGTLANGGVRMPAHGILEIKDAEGTVLSTAEPADARTIPADVAYLATDMLKGVIAGGTGTKARIGRPAAGKTGTTQEYRDAWFVGYTPDMVASVWVGFPEAQREMTSVHGRKVTGGSFPAEIWAAFMKEALKDREKTDFKRPDGLSTLSICLESGQKAGGYCTKTGKALFLADASPGECELHSQPTEITVPNLVGMTQDAALALLKQLLLLFAVNEQDSATVPAGTVISQDPAAGSLGTTQTVITLAVSRGVPKSTAPTPVISYKPPQPKAGDTVTFDGAASTDDGTIKTYAWEFGDGAPLVEGVEVAHAYTSPGTYTVTLWVTDDGGNVESTTAELQVR